MNQGVGELLEGFEQRSDQIYVLIRIIHFAVIKIDCGRGKGGSMEPVNRPSQ